MSRILFLLQFPNLLQFSFDFCFSLDRSHQIEAKHLQGQGLSISLKEVMIDLEGKSSHEISQNLTAFILLKTFRTDEISLVETINNRF